MRHRNRINLPSALPSRPGRNDSIGILGNASLHLLLDKSAILFAEMGIRHRDLLLFTFLTQGNEMWKSLHSSTRYRRWCRRPMLVSIS